MTRRRHGRVRRWVVRPVVWGLALLSVATVALLVYLESDGFARRVRSFAEGWLESRFERQVSVGWLDLELLPLRLEAGEVRIAGQEPESPPFLTAERVLIDATVGSFLRPGVRLDLIVVEKPSVSVRFDETGRHDAPTWRRRRDRSRGDRLVEVEIGRVEVVGGTVDLGDERYPLDFSAAELTASLTGGAELGELKGRASASEVTVALPRARPYLGELVVDGAYRPGRVDIRQARVSGPDLDAGLSGVWRWRDVQDLDLKVVADTRLELLERLGLGGGIGTGGFRFAGTIRRLPREWFVTGSIDAASTVVLDRRLSAVTGRVFSDRDDVRIEIDSSRYGGGAVSGTVIVPFGTGRPTSVSLELDDVALGRLLADQSIPLDGLAGVASGVVDYRFERSDPRGGNGWAELDVRPAPPAGRAWLPVRGSLPLTIAAGRIASEAIRVGAERQLLTAGLAYDLASSSGAFDYRIETRDVSELVALLPLAGEPQPWQPGTGVGSITGRLDLGGDGTRATVRLDLAALAARGFTAERLRGGFTVTASGLEAMRLELMRPGGAMLVAGDVPFDEVIGADAPPFEIAVDADGWPLEDVEAWLPWSLPAGGDFSGSLELSGSLAAPQGLLAGRLEPLRTAAGELAELDLEVGFTPYEVTVESARVGLGSGGLELAGRITLPGGELDLDLASRSLRLESLPLVADLPGGLTGVGEIAARLGGTLAEPRLEGRVTGREVEVGGRAVAGSEEAVVEFLWAAGELDVSGSAAGLVAIDGGGALDWETADLTFDVATERLGRVLDLVTGSEEPLFEGSAAGRLIVRGSLGAESELAAELVAEDLELERGAVTLVNLEPVVLVFGSAGIVVRSLYLGAPGSSSELFVRGTLGAAGGELDLDVQATVDDEWLAPWLVDITVDEGVFDLIGKVSGSPAAPRFDGVGEARGARVVVAGYPSAFEDVGAVVLFYPQRLVVDSGSAEVAGGSLLAAGTVDLGSAGGPAYRFQVQGTDLGFRYPEGWVVRGDAEVTLASTAGGRLVSGGLRLDRAFYTRDVPLEIDQLLAALFERRRIEAGDVEPWRSETALNLEIETDEGLRIRNNLANLTGRAELVLRGSLARPIVFGGVELAPGGTLVYRGQEFTVERGALTFANPYRVEPVIDLVAATQMREYDITLALGGTLDRLRADFVSEPPLPELEVLALLTGGRDPRRVTPDPGESTVESVAADTFLYGQATSLITGRFNRLFGLDQFRIDPLTSSTGDLSSARVTVGKRLSRDLVATYSYDPVQTDEQILEIEWSISRSLVLVLTQNGDGTYAVDARWEKVL